MTSPLFSPNSLARAQSITSSSPEETVLGPPASRSHPPHPPSILHPPGPPPFSATSPATPANRPSSKSSTTSPLSPKKKAPTQDTPPVPPDFLPSLRFNLIPSPKTYYILSPTLSTKEAFYFFFFPSPEHPATFRLLHPYETLPRLVFLTCASAFLRAPDIILIANDSSAALGIPSPRQILDASTSPASSFLPSCRDETYHIRDQRAELHLPYLPLPVATEPTLNPRDSVQAPRPPSPHFASCHLIRSARSSSTVTVSHRVPIGLCCMPRDS